MKKIGNNKFAIATGISILSVVAVFILAQLNLFHSLELKTVDLRFQLRGPYTGLLGASDVRSDSLDVVLVDLDDESWRLIPAQWPYSRAIWSRVTDNLVRAGAKVIVFDIMFDAPGSGYAEGDTMFAQSIRNAEQNGTHIVLAAKKATETTRVPPSYIQQPIELLLNAGASIGLINEVKDADGFTRNYLMYDTIENNETVYPSLAANSFQHYIQWKHGSDYQLVDKNAHGKRVLDFDALPKITRINFYGPPSSGGPSPQVGPWKTFHRYPLSGVLDDASFDLKNPQEDTNWMELFYPDGLLSGFGMSDESPFQNKIVMIGVSLAEFHDLKETPYYSFRGYQDLMPGFEIHANALQMMLDNNWIKETSAWVLLVTVVFAAIVLGLVNTALPPLGGAAVFIIMFWLYIETSFGFFFQDFFWSIPLLFDILISSDSSAPFVGPPAFGGSFYLPVIAPLAGLTATYAGNVLFQFISTRREKRWIKDAFGHFLHPEIVQEITENPEKLKLGGVRRRLTVFFSDIENFTTIAERMAAENLVEFLNQYLTELTDIVLENNGIIDKYEGDAIMAEFGAPIERPDHAKLACRAAIQIQRRLTELRKEWEHEGIPEIKTRIGINTGEVALGNFGSRDVFDYTAMGDTVNLGARLESANKKYGTYILISEYTKNELDESFITRPMDKVIVKGKTEPVFVYELLDESSEHILVNNPDLLITYNEAFENYMQRNWETAAAQFEMILKSDADDKPAQVLKDRCKMYQKEEPGDDWDGSYSFVEK